MAYADPCYHGGKNWQEQITDEHLTCTMCHVPGFRSPKMLPKCGHSFCLACLEKHTGLRCDTPVQVDHFFPCPLCGIRTTVPLKGLQAINDDLSKMYQIDTLLRRHNNQRGREDSVYNISCYAQNRTTEVAYFPSETDKRFGPGELNRASRCGDSI